LQQLLQGSATTLRSFLHCLSCYVLFFEVINIISLHYVAAPVEPCLGCYIYVTGCIYVCTFTIIFVISAHGSPSIKITGAIDVLYFVISGLCTDVILMTTIQPMEVNLQMWRFRATIVAMEKQTLFLILSLCLQPMYPACNNHAQYFHLCPAWLYFIFPRFLTIDTIFVKKIDWNERCLIFYATFFWKISVLLISQLGTKIHIHSSLCEVRVIPVRFYWNLNFLGTFSKNPQIKN
jgi:hypothetical protein